MSEALRHAVLRYMDANGGEDGLYATAIDGVGLMRSASETPPHPLIQRPALCVVVQGAKQLMLGDQTFDYREGQALMVSVELPAFGRVTQASMAAPFLGITVELDVGMIREVLERLEVPPKPGGSQGVGVFVEDLASPLVDGVLRLIRLLDTPGAIPVLSPSVLREICFWLLTGANGGKVCKFVLPSGHAQRIAEAIYVLRDDFKRPVRIEELAAAAGMSPSSFYQHFKTLTAMTPLQYQKQLRLLEARRLMVADAANVENAAYEVGYESPSQFSREYARMFGAPPKRDVAGLKALSV